MYANQKIKRTPSVCVCVFSLAPCKILLGTYKILPVPAPQYTVWLTDLLPVSPTALYTLRLQECKEIYISERKPAGGQSLFPVGPPTSGTSFLSLSMIQTRQLSNPHSRTEIQHSLQPAACASLSSPADCAGIVGWLDVICGYSVVCVCVFVGTLYTCAIRIAHTLPLSPAHVN